jgi:adenine-specific DNA-methyltransferase
MQEIVWNYGAGVAARKFFSPRNEKLLWYVKNENEYTFNLDDVRDPDVKYPNQKKGLLGIEWAVLRVIAAVACRRGL